MTNNEQPVSERVVTEWGVKWSRRNQVGFEMGEDGVLIQEALTMLRSLLVERDEARETAQRYLDCGKSLEGDYREMRKERDKALGELAAAREEAPKGQLIATTDFSCVKCGAKNGARIYQAAEKQPEQPAAARESELDKAVAHLAGISDAVNRERDFCFALVEGCHDLRIVQDVTSAYLKRREKRRALAEKS